MEQTSIQDQTTKASNSVEHENLFQAFNDSMWHSLAAPAFAVDQLVDKIQGKPTTAFQPELPQERFGSANFWAQRLGDMVGKATWVIGTELGLKRLGQMSGVIGTFGEMTRAQRIGLGVSTGFMYGGFLVPVSEHSYTSNYWANKAIQATFDAAAVGVIHVPKASTEVLASLTGESAF